ncbi:cytidine deaminase [Aestuariivivens sediminicola]|uniref:cytidine deaminase n=1 Tax=Aestuariivivens sediminicola TaxID=2913560 RepID=UPI001F57BCD2|nr:cytidine deaminase [Aestuariivivens sediminicola]
MKEINIPCVVHVYDDRDQLTADVKDLMESAVSARDSAYAPYSDFKVGAALLLDNGEVITGSNQENASYPSGLCAERTVVYYAGAKYPDARFLKMCITAASSNSTTFDPIPPCGACRQAIVEYEIKQESPIEIYFMGASGKVMKSHSLANLLPLVFDKSVL